MRYTPENEAVVRADYIARIKAIQAWHAESQPSNAELLARLHAELGSHAYHAVGEIGYYYGLLMRPESDWQIALHAAGFQIRDEFAMRELPSGQVLVIWPKAYRAHSGAFVLAVYPPQNDLCMESSGSPWNILDQEGPCSDYESCQEFPDWQSAARAAANWSVPPSE